MKNSIFACLLAIVMMPCCALAHGFVVDGICYNVTSEIKSTCEVTFCSDEVYDTYRKFYKGVVTVPDKVIHNGKEYTVTSVGYNAFKGNDGLLSVVLPNTIVSIDNGAFSNCPNFKSFTLPASVRLLDNWAFASLPSLEQLAVDERNPIFDSRDGCNAIIYTRTASLVVGCRTTIIPDGVTEIMYSAFKSCNVGGQAMEPFEINIPGSVKTILAEAFKGCSSLVAVSLNEGLEKIDYYAFEGTSIKRVVIPASVKDIRRDVFRECTSLKSIKVKKDNKVYDSRGGCNAIIDSEKNRLIAECGSTSIPEGVTR